ncbi:MAG: hypothetical protein HRU20_00200 [Pseudomonadales bacterium]|nr:hypothetical protein [Pseudomonadales bacterium]
MWRSIKVFLSLVFLFQSLLCFSIEGMLVSNKDVSATALDSKELQSIFMGKKTSWDNGVSISPCYITPTSAESQRFFEDITNKNYLIFKRYWNRKLFSGNDIPPRNFSTIEDLLDYASHIKGAICFIHTAEIQLPANVKRVEMN